MIASPLIVLGLVTAGAGLALKARGAVTSGGSVAAEADALARTMWGEARGDGERGMWGVGQVAATRVDSSRWPNTFRGVVFQDRQFSMWNPGDPNGPRARRVTTADSAFRLALDLARRIVGGERDSRFRGVAHFFNPRTSDPSWQHTASSSFTIGSHKFLKGVA